MMEFIIMRGFLFSMVFLMFTVLIYYGCKLPLKESIISGLCIGIFFTVSGIAFEYYQLITAGIITGITVSLLVIVYRYYIYKAPLKDSIKWGLIAGIIAAIAFPILRYLIFDLIL